MKYLDTITLETTEEKLQELEQKMQQILIEQQYNVDFTNNSFITSISIANHIYAIEKIYKSFKDIFRFLDLLNPAQKQTHIFKIKRHLENSELCEFISLSNNTIHPNLNHLATSNELDIQQLKDSLLLLSGRTKLLLLETINEYYYYCVGNQFSGILMLDLQLELQNTHLNNFNPIKQITHSEVVFDEQKVIQNIYALKYYFDIISVGIKNDNPQSEKIIFNLADYFPNFLNPFNSYWQELSTHKPRQISPSELTQCLAQNAPSFFYTLFIETAPELNNLKQAVVNILNKEIFEDPILEQKLQIDILNALVTPDENKSKIQELFKLSKLQKHKNRKLTLIIFLSLCITNNYFKTILEQFLESQETSNNGAKRLYQLAKKSISLAQLTSQPIDLKASSPQSIIENITGQIVSNILSTLNINELEQGIKESKFASHKLCEIIEPLSHLIKPTNKEIIQDILIHHIMQTPLEIKKVQSITNKTLEPQTQQEFLENLSIKTATHTTFETNNIKTILNIGQTPQITCFNYINGTHKNELLGLILLNDRKVVICNQGQEIVGRAVIKILRTISHTNYALVIDNIYGNFDSIQEIIKLAELKATYLGFQLCLPKTHYYPETQRALQFAIQQFKHKIENNKFSQLELNANTYNYSDVLDRELLIVSNQPLN